MAIEKIIRIQKVKISLETSKDSIGASSSCKKFETTEKFDKTKSKGSKFERITDQKQTSKFCFNKQIQK